MEWWGLCSEEVGVEHAYEIIQSFHANGIEARGNALGLVKEESLAIHAYTWGRDGAAPFAILNAQMRGGAEHTRFGYLFSEVLRAGLTKLPKCKGTFYRKTSHPSLKQLRKKDSFQDRGFLSASRLPEAFSGDHMMVIEGLSGRDVASMSSYPEEDEVVFLPKALFTVEEVVRSSGHTVAVISEIEQNA